MTTEELNKKTIEFSKTEGNNAFGSGHFLEAIDHFTNAINESKTLGGAGYEGTHILYSNRSAAYASLEKYTEALNDADAAITLNPRWAKGHGRRGAALVGLRRYEEAATAYQEGLTLEPENNMLKSGLESVQRYLSSNSQSQNFKNIPGKNPIADPEVWNQRVFTDPKMIEYLRDHEFKTKVDAIRADPSSLIQHMQDERIMHLFSLLLGCNLKSTCSDASCQDDSCATLAQKQESIIKPAEEEADENVRKALAKKELGNSAYKQKKFEEALEHYDSALEFDPKNISIYTNKAAVYFELAQYEECIKVCELAVDTGRENYADFKLIARAIGRIGSSKERLGYLEGAVIAYQKSLTEHRTPEVLQKLRDVEKKVEQRKREEYLNPEIAEEEKIKGNALFKDGDFAGAIKHYTEAIRRNDTDAKLYSNRAACYTKLAAVPEGLKDCEKAIALDPKFVKSYIRKAALLVLKREFTKALDTLALVQSMDKEGLHAAEINTQYSRCYQQQQGMMSANGGEKDEDVDDETRIKRAIERDPEVGKILSDPAMMQMLRQMQENPAAGMSFMQNPDFAAKLRRLAAAGVVRVGP